MNVDHHCCRNLTIIFGDSYQRFKSFWLVSRVAHPQCHQTNGLPSHNLWGLKFTTRNSVFCTEPHVEGHIVHTRTSFHEPVKDPPHAERQSAKVVHSSFEYHSLQGPSWSIYSQANVTANNKGKKKKEKMDKKWFEILGCRLKYSHVQMKKEINK